jgi:hypothetical protein
MKIEGQQLLDLSKKKTEARKLMHISIMSLQKIENLYQVRQNHMNTISDTFFLMHPSKEYGTVTNFLLDK